MKIGALMVFAERALNPNQKIWTPANESATSYVLAAMNRSDRPHTFTLPELYQKDLAASVVAHVRHELGKLVSSLTFRLDEVSGEPAMRRIVVTNKKTAA